MPDSGPTVLLDSCGSGEFGPSWRFSGYAGTVQALAPDEVAAVLAKVEQASDTGLHAVGFVAYEAAHSLNPDLPPLDGVEGMPLAWFALFLHRRPARAYEGVPVDDGTRIDLVPTLDQAAHAAAVGRIREYIAAGDCYQVNYTFPMTAGFSGDPLSLYRRICQGQKAPFSAYIDTGRFTIISASPELFFSLRSGVITARPMKGTARRGRWWSEDRKMAALLRDNPKERAENLMIVDLIRNDLGVVAKTGTVHVDSLFDLETYPTVLQMTSTVSARLRSGVGVAEIFRALFPCGSVTGAPKRRAMEIIHELEPTPRGAYCGAIGYISPDREARFSVAIRTLTLDRTVGTLTLGVGSGITWDASAEAEYRECLDKGAFLRQEEGFDLVESLRLVQGKFSLLERHINRMAAAAAYFGFPFAAAEARRQLAVHAADSSGIRKVRLLLSPDGRLTVSSEELSEENIDRPLRIALAMERVHSTDPFVFHKTTRRGFFQRARANRPDCDELLFVNERGEVTEGTYHNLVVRLDGRLFTPPVSSGLLPGTLREELLERKEIEERILSPAELEEAEEVWLINSVRGWRRATLMEKEECR